MLCVGVYTDQQVPVYVISSFRRSYLQENEKNITLCKSLNHPKIASTIVKKPNPPLEKFSISQKTLTPGKIFNSFEVTRSTHPPPHEKISIPENLTPCRKLQYSHAHENRN